MANPDQFVAACLSQKGDPYVFGAEASPLDPDPDRFDCSELVEWAAKRAHIPGVPDGAYWQWKAAKRVSVAEGLRTRGALLFVGDGTGVGRAAITHVAVSLGDGTTIEARGKRWGVGTWGAAGRFDFAGLIPGIDYKAKPATRPVNQGGGVNLDPGVTSQATKFLQALLNIVRAAAGDGRIQITVDGHYGNQTKAAVAEFQRDVNELERRTVLKVTGAADPKTLGYLADWVNFVMAAK